MVTGLVQAIEGVAGVSGAVTALASLLFVGWIVADARRTRHLVRLLQALRRQGGR